MVLSFPYKFSRFNTLPRLPQRPAEAADAARPAPALSTADDPVFLRPGFALLEPDLTDEIRQALGENAACRSADVP